VRVSIGAVRNVVGLVLGFGFGLILTSPAVSALSMVPGLSLLAPSDNSNVSGTITFVAAADSEGLVSLQFKVDGNDYGSTITSGSCRATFDTRSTNDGPHTIQAVGQDEFGNATFTQPATIFVNNVAPAISNLVVSNVTSSSATVNWATAAAADGRVDYGVTMGYGGSAYDSNVATSHAVTLTGLSSGTTYHFSAMSFGQNGILSSSGDFVFTTSGAPVVPTPTPSPTPTPTPSPGPSPTPRPPTPGPTPVPTPVPSPSPTPTPIVSPNPTPTPTASPSSFGTHGRTAPSGSDNIGSAIPRTDQPVEPSPTPIPTVTGQANARGSSASVNPVPGASAVSRATGAAIGYVTGFSGGTGGSGQGLTVGMLMPGSSTRTGLAAQQNSQTTSTQSRTPTRSTDAQPTYTPCAGPNPFLNETNGGSCVNGTWIKNEPPAETTNDPATAQTTAPPDSSGAPVTSVTSAPVTSASSAPSVSGSSSVTSAPAAAPKSTAASCSKPDPYAAKGGIGLCVNGDWVLLWKPSKGK
jgi:hypothetical protein